MVLQRLNQGSIRQTMLVIFHSRAYTQCRYELTAFKHDPDSKLSVMQSNHRSAWPHCYTITEALSVHRSLSHCRTARLSAAELTAFLKEGHISFPEPIHSWMENPRSGPSLGVCCLHWIEKVTPGLQCPAIIPAQPLASLAGNICPSKCYQA